MKNTIIIAASFLLISCNSSIAQHTKVLDQQTYAQEIKENKVVLIDVRTPEEYSNGHLPDAKNINVMDDNFEINIQELDKNQPVYIYCQSGKRSAKAANKMEALGFTKIYDLANGYSAWKGETQK